MGEPKVLYLCDGRACDKCNYGFSCRHTTDIRHAKNFRILGPEFGTNHLMYFEEESNMAEQTKQNVEIVDEVVADKKVEKSEKKRNFKDLDKDSQRFYNLLHVIFNICTLSGFRIEEHMKIRDLKTGKLWE